MPPPPGFTGPPPEVLRELPILHNVCIAFMCIVGVSYAIRLFVKLRILKTFKADDIALLVSFLLFIPTVAAGLMFTLIGARVARGDIGAISEIAITAKIFSATYTTGAMSAKVSICLLLRSLTGLDEKTYRYIAYFITAVSSAFGCVYFAFGFTCGVVDIEENNRHCSLYGPANTSSLAWSISNMVADIVFAALFIGLICSNIMNLRSRVVASTLLCLSSVGAVASVFRVATLLGWGWNSLDGQRLQVTRWSIIEMGICIFAISMTSARPMLRKILQGTSLIRSSSYDGTREKTREQSVTADRMKEKSGDVPFTIGLTAVIEA